jgi:hypothetical protein
MEEEIDPGVREERGIALERTRIPRVIFVGAELAQWPSTTAALR